MHAFSRHAVLAAALFFCAAPALADPTPNPATAHNAVRDFALPPQAAQTPAHAAALPTTALHAEYVVETNRKGQVTRLRSGRASTDPKFNLITYGNVMQTFIRTTDGHAVAGTFRLKYDYSPVTQGVQRRVELVRAGGVDPNALGAVVRMAQEARKRAAASKTTHK